MSKAPVLFVAGKSMQGADDSCRVQGLTVRTAGTGVSCVLENGSAFASNYIENIVAVQKGTDGETVFFRQWLLHRDNSARWEHIEDFLQETVRYAIRGNKNSQMAKAGEGILLYAYRAVRAGRMDPDGKTTVFMTAVISSIPVG